MLIQPCKCEFRQTEGKFLQLIAEGKSVKEIAAALNISAKTVEFHRGSIAEVLGLRPVAELTRYALQHGISGLRRRRM